VRRLQASIPTHAIIRANAYGKSSEFLITLRASQHLGEGGKNAAAKRDRFYSFRDGFSATGQRAVAA
jgi:hypothetical protein